MTAKWIICCEDIAWGRERYNYNSSATEHNISLTNSLPRQLRGGYIGGSKTTAISRRTNTPIALLQTFSSQIKASHFSSSRTYFESAEDNIIVQYLHKGLQLVPGMTEFIFYPI